MIRGEIYYNPDLDRLEIRNARETQTLKHGDYIELRIGNRWMRCVALFDGSNWNVQLADWFSDISCNGVEARRA